MNDPLKKYIQDNRDDFDTLEPAAEIFSKLKKELKLIPKEKKGVLVLMINHKLLVAATVLITMSITYLLLTNHIKNINVNNQQFAKNIIPRIASETKKDVDVKDANEIIKTTPKVVKRTLKRQAKDLNILAIYDNLTDSTSASTRLAAILNLQKSTIISYDIIDKLTQTLNHDSNSNVRLAALNLMSKYAQDSYVNNAFMLSLSNQKDPLLQLGLMELLSQTNSPKLDDKLYALANDPTTLAEVKDQAYFILLNQNKL